MKHSRSLFLLISLLTPIASFGADCSTGLVYIDPSASAAGDGSAALPLKSWPSVLKAGSCYVQKTGTTVNGNITITSAPGTPELPIIMAGYGTAANPVIKGTIDIQNSANLKVVGFTVTGSIYPGIVVRKNSKNVTVLQNTVFNCAGGISLTDGALGGHLIANNFVYDNINGTPDFPPFGITVYKIGNTSASPTVIYGNYVFGNGGSGIELFANHNYVQRNFVYKNGKNTPGSSGIHVYAGSFADPRPDLGNNNLIMQNVTVANVEIAMQDGNGIQLDQYANKNIVYQNVGMLNDGPGMSMYDAYDNHVSNNQFLGNAVDTSKSHIYKTELMLVSEGSNVNLSKRNTFASNQFLAILPENVAAYVDSFSSAAAQGNIFSGNYLYNLSGGNVFFWSGTTGKQASVWNTLILPQGGSADFFSGLPLTPAASAPTTLQYDFGPSGTPLTIDGKNVILKGWSPGIGFVLK